MRLVPASTREVCPSTAWTSSSARQRLSEFDDLLEGGAILEREGRYRDPAHAHPPVHVKAARLRVFRAGAVAVDLRWRNRQRFKQRVLERSLTCCERAFAAVDF